MRSCQDKLVLVQSSIIDIIVGHLISSYNGYMSRCTYLTDRRNSLRAFTRSLVSRRAFVISLGPGGLVGSGGSFT